MTNPETGETELVRSAFETMEIVPTCFFAYSTDLLAKAADELGYHNDAKEYQALLEKIRHAFATEYVDEKGHLPKDLQGLYVRALKFGLIPVGKIAGAIKKLVSLIEANGNRLDTGFMSIPHLLDVLEENGHIDLAYDLLFQEECPSWLYAVKKGATSIWEAWQAILEDGTPMSVSYNHYSFGCVGEWMYRTIGGLKPILPGYKHFSIKPILDDRLSWAEVKYNSRYGLIESHWKRESDGIKLRVEVPMNTKATIHLSNNKEVVVGSGTHVFIVPFQDN
jgi:alpha-L-rhamnosidase